MDDYAEQTYGEKLVRLDFNPSGSQLVIDIKQFTADLINMVESNKAKEPRLAALAITSYECAAMWAVKMATTTEQPLVIPRPTDAGIKY